MNCQTVEEKLTLRLYDELSPEERAQVEAHLGACQRCAATAAELGRLREALNQRPVREPAPDLLVRCRWDLEEALDREATSWRALVRSWLGASPRAAAMRFSSVAAILLVGFSLGWGVQRLTTAPGPSGTSPAAPLTGANLTNWQIGGISQVTPDPQTGAVQITLDAQRRMTLEGSLDDPRIRDVLLYAMKSYDNPGIRLDTLEVLRGQAGDPYVREAFLHALRRDPNPGVRLEALEAISEAGWGPGPRRAITETLERESNDGVRIAAINLLLRHADQDPNVMTLLEHLAEKDRNPYVRMKCATAVQERVRAEY
ncbi:MAG: zf-HC2 domain-containing protein [Terriglobia bacterium]